MQRFVLSLVILLIANCLVAQKDNRLAKGLLPIEQVMAERMPPQDNEALLSEELARRGPGVAPRYATNISVDFTPETHGVWESTPEGMVWRLRIHSPTAHSLNLGFTEYFMPRGGQLLLYTPDYKEVRGPFTPADNEDHEQLWTPLLFGEEIVVEVQLPAERAHELRLKLSYVNHAFENFSALISGSCNLDVICDAADGWGIVDPHRDIIQSVAVISTGGGTFCTGFLVNNVENDCRPFFMTANHCGINTGNAPSLVTYWNFQNSTCREPFSAASGGPGDGQLNDFNTGSIFRASRSQSDFVLVELDDPVSPTANAYLAGWDASAAAISNAIAVHHPRTDEKRISFENDPTQFTTYGSSTPTPNFTHVRVVDWDVGTTEPGSSGSPLFDQDERVVGQLHGGGAACGNNQSDWYGAFAVSWDAGGSASSRLRDWLDPNNTGILTIDGRWANECGFTLSADPVNQEVCQPDDAFYEIEVSSGFSGTVSLFAEDLPPGANAFFSPSMVSPGGSSSLSIQTAGADPGVYTFTVVGENGGDSGQITLGITILPDPSTPPVLISPDDNSIDVFPNPILSWDGDETGATTYQVQIATDINFSNIVETGSTNTTSYQPVNASQGANQYFWRVRGMNECGTGFFSDEFDFTTSSISCITYTSDFSTTISANGTPSIENNIFFNEDEPIAAVMVMMDITHSYVGDLDATLVSPDGSSIELFDRPGVPGSNFGCSEDNLNLSFSQSSLNSAALLENTCNDSQTGANNPGAPYAIEGDFQPLDNLDDLLGESSLGMWTLEVNDNASDDGGILEEWSITVCYEIPTEPPYLLTNQRLTVPHNTQETITNTYLEAGDDMSSAAEIEFILTDMPNEGMLLLNGVMLNLGDSFTQADIDDGLLVYQHEGGVVLMDEFTFDLINSAGLVASDNVFQIEILIEALTIDYNQLSENDCNGDTNASIEVIANGGVMPYEYAINGGAFQPENVFTNLGAGSFFVSIRDMTGTEISSNSFLIMHPEELLAMTDVTDDQVTIMAMGGTPDYTYQLEDGATQDSPIFSNLPNGTHTFTVTDANGCQTTVMATVAVNTLVVNASIQQQISCHDANDGSILAEASGGMPPYEYRINAGPLQPEPLFTALAAGTYIVEVIDQEGFTQASISLTIINPAALNLSASVDEDEITLSASGGTPPLMYQLNEEAPQEDPTFSGLDNGTYTMTVIDANGCETSVEATVAVNTLVVAASLVSDISCNDVNDGIIETTVSGGSPTYLYSLDGVNYQVENTFTGLAAGTYTVTVLDSEGFMQTSGSVTITNPTAISGSTAVMERTITVTASGGTEPLLYQLEDDTPQSNPSFTDLANGTYTITVIDANGCELELMATVAVNTLMVAASLNNDISCHDANDGSISVSVSGGAAPFQYSLDGGMTYQPENTFTNLAAGTYTVTVLDNEGFTSTTNSITITNPSAVVGSASVDESTITIVASGGTGPLTYQLNDGMPQSSPVFTGVPNGVYTITVADANGCEIQLSATVAVNTLVVSASLVNDISCFNAHDGQISVSVSGGTAPFEYSLNGMAYQPENTFANLAAGMYTVTVRDAEGFTQSTNTTTINNPTELVGTIMVTDNNITVDANGGTAPLMYQLNDLPPQSEPTFDDLDNGAYTISVIDANGCTISFTTSISINTLVVSALLVNDISCFNVNDGSISATVQGGTAPYQYSLDGENFQSEATFNGLSQGNYSITVLDAEGFTQQTNSIAITNPVQLMMNVEVDGANITINASGGTGALEYSVNGIDFQDENTFTDLPDGNYQVTVRDENGCAIVTGVSIDENTLAAEVSLGGSIDCFGESGASITITASGGMSPYRYSIDGGENWQTSNIFTDLPAGTYDIVVEDDANHSFMISMVEILQPAALEMTATSGGSTINIMASGGTGMLMYSIDGVNFQSEPTFTALPNGEYEVTVRDENGCTLSQTVLVDDQSLFAEVELEGAINCNGDTGLSITLNASGGTPPYLYSIDGGENWQASNTFTDLPAGNYAPVVEDAVGNTFTTLNVTVAEPELLVVNATVEGNDLVIEASGGTGPYLYSIDGVNFSEENIFPNLPAGDYMIWVEDANGCLSSTMTSILVGIFTPEVADLDLTVYPNPTNGQFYIRLEQNEIQDLSTQIFDARGRLVVQHQHARAGLTFEQSFDLSQLAAGVYQVVISNGESFGRAKVVVIK